MKISMLGHSGFLVEGNRACLVFDLFTDEKGILDELPIGKKDTIFFVSHAHSDHYNKKIFSLAQGGSVAYVLDSGVKPAKAANVTLMKKGDSAEIFGALVRAFGSTDMGLSFLVEFEGKTIFHAGDLNDWYWEEESTPEELLHDEGWFLREIEPLQDARPDVAFLPVDARLGGHALRGPLHFARAMQPELIVPMHLAGGYNLPGELAEALQDEKLKIEVAELFHPGDTMQV